MASQRLLRHVMMTGRQAGRQREGIWISSLHLVPLSLFSTLSSQGKTGSVHSTVAKEAACGF